MKSTIRLNQLKEIIESYEYPIPLREHLQEYFRKNKNAGSRDRKELRQLCNSYFRLGKSLGNLTFEDKSFVADFLFNSVPLLEQKFTEDYSLDIDSKLAIIQNHYPDFTIESVFPFPDEITSNIDKDSLLKSYLHQASVWIKVTPGKQKFVETELELNGIEFEKYNELAWKFKSNEKLTELPSFQKAYFRIQDLSTQSTVDYYKASEGEKWWDACAGAGGKSLSLVETYKGVELYVSDIRETILKNLEDRFKKHHVRPARILKTDLEKATPALPQMDGIVVDAPCTGSGTWARSPEHLAYFNKDSITLYTEKQLRILDHVYPLLKTGKPLIYITCSVYSRENENVIEAFCAKHSVKIEEQKYLEGYRNGAENIFLCRMIKTEA